MANLRRTLVVRSAFGRRPLGLQSGMHANLGKSDCVIRSVGMKRSARLSASTISVLLECPRCFLLQVNENSRRPQGPFPSLPGGIDAVLKKYLDAYRKGGELPPDLVGKVPGGLFPDQQKLDRWRDALRGDLRFTDAELGVEVSGGLDDLLIEGDKLTPLDFKTRGWPVKEDTHRHYEHQLDLYAWLLEKLGYRTSGRGVLLFFSPVSYEGHGTVKFRIESVEMNTNTKRAGDLLGRAVQVLRGPLPKDHAECSFCRFAATRAVQETGE